MRPASVTRIDKDVACQLDFISPEPISREHRKQILDVFYFLSVQYLTSLHFALAVHQTVDTTTTNTITSHDLLWRLPIVFYL